MRHPELCSQQHLEDKALGMPTIPGNPKHSALLCLGSVSIPAGKLWHPVPRGNGFPTASPLLQEAENMEKANPGAEDAPRGKPCLFLAGRQREKLARGGWESAGKQLEMEFYLHREAQLPQLLPPGRSWKHQHLQAPPAPPSLHTGAVSAPNPPQPRPSQRHTRHPEPASFLSFPSSFSEHPASVFSLQMLLKLFPNLLPSAPAAAQTWNARENPSSPAGSSPTGCSQPSISFLSGFSP